MPFMIFAPWDNLQVRYQNVFVTKMFLLPVATPGIANVPPVGAAKLPAARIRQLCSKAGTTS